mmetsp:Transcript_76367/g.212157  ORF Transcript_76367/g.212157 Transcript_76367/m.212157 type:complete len:109 (-) Transcript_76367:122-448(-)
MAARASAVACLALFVAAVVFALHAAPRGGDAAFVAPAANVEDQAVSVHDRALRGTAPVAAVVALAAAAPLPAQALSETELNRFGLFFMVFFLGFWLAAFARLLSIGRL